MTSCTSLTEFPQHKSKMTSDWCVFKFLRLSVDGKNLMHFQSQTSVFKFLRRTVDLASVKQTDADGVKHGKKGRENERCTPVGNVENRWPYNYLPSL